MASGWVGRVYETRRGQFNLKHELRHSFEALIGNRGCCKWKTLKSRAIKARFVLETDQHRYVGYLCTENNTDDQPPRSGQGFYDK